jgi:hypothetical protein
MHNETLSTVTATAKSKQTKASAPVDPVDPNAGEYRSAETVKVDKFVDVLGRTGKTVSHPILAVCPCGVQLVGRCTKTIREGVVGAYLTKQGVLVSGQAFLLALQGLKVKRDTLGFPLRLRQEIVETLKLHSLTVSK